MRAEACDKCVIWQWFSTDIYWVKIIAIKIKRVAKSKKMILPPGLYAEGLYWNFYSRVYRRQKVSEKVHQTFNLQSEI